MKNYFYCLALAGLLTTGCATTSQPTTASDSAQQEGNRTPANDQVLSYSPSQNYTAPLLLLAPPSIATAALEKATDALLSRSEDHIRYCFEKGLNNDQTPNVSHVFYFTVFPNRKIGEIISESKQDGDGVRDFDLCIIKMLKGLQAPTANEPHIFRWKLNTRLQ